MKHVVLTEYCGDNCVERLSMPTPTGGNEWALCETHRQWWSAQVDNSGATWVINSSPPPLLWTLAEAL